MEEERASCYALCVFSCCRVAVSVLCLFLMVLWVVLWPVIVVFPSHTNLILFIRLYAMRH